MERIVLSNDRVSKPVEEQVASFHRDIVEAVDAAVKRDPVVVVGMAQNPFVKKARKLLEAEGIAFTYLEYGSYLSKWQQRLAIKLYAGFPTFPMVFMDGKLVGGNADLVKLRDAGKLKKSS
jgi:glutaredoxin-related protein